MDQSPLQQKQLQYVQVSSSQPHQQQNKQTQNIQNKQLKQQHQQIRHSSQNIKQQVSRHAIQIIQEIEQKGKDKPEQLYPNIAKIYISQIIQTGSGLNKHLVYHIVGSDNHGPIDAYRRYSEFQALDNILYQRWPGCFIPFVSNKSQIKNPVQNQIYVKEILANYLIGLSYSEHLYYREEVQLFLRAPIQNIKEMYSQMPPLKTKDVISRYRSSFQQQIQVKSPAQNMTYIQRFTTSLRKIMNSLHIMSQRALVLAQSYQAYSKNAAKFGQIGKRYERLCLNEYTNVQEQKMIITKHSENKLAQLELLTKKNPFYQLYAHIYNQQRDAQAFIEVIIAAQLFDLRRDELEAEIKSLQKSIEQIAIGGLSLSVVTTRRPKEVVQGQLQTKQKRLVQERSYMIQIHNVLQIVLAKKAIRLFKKLKRDRYEKILKQWITFVTQTNKQIAEAWKTVYDESKTLLQK